MFLGGSVLVESWLFFGRLRLCNQFRANQFRGNQLRGNQLRGNQLRGNQLCVDGTLVLRWLFEGSFIFLGLLIACCELVVGLLVFGLLFLGSRLDLDGRLFLGVLVARGDVLQACD